MCPYERIVSKCTDCQFPRQYCHCGGDRAAAAAEEDPEEIPVLPMAACRNSAADAL